jgi:hypothetical protein
MIAWIAAAAVTFCAPQDTAALRGDESPFPLSGSPGEPARGEDPGSGLSAWARGEYWSVKSTGQLVITRGSRPGTGGVGRIGEDFGLERQGVPAAELGASLGDHRLRLSYLDLHLRGTEELDQDLVFHGETYPAGAEVRAELDLPRLSLGYDYDVWDTPWTSTRVGVVGHLYWVGARLASGALDERRGYSRAIPALTASVEARSGAFHAALDGSLGYSDSDSALFGGARLLLGGRLWGTLDLDLGYRWERLDASAETNRVALTVHGPELSVAVRF